MYLLSKLSKIAVFLLAIILFTCQTNTTGENFKQRFDEYWEQGDLDSQENLLERWESQNPDDPELYTSYFNYFCRKSNETLALKMDSTPPEGEGFAIQDSSGNIAGYIGSGSSELIQKGIDYIDKGIEKFPRRLDMRFGKIYILGENQNWEAFTAEILKTIDVSNKIENKWLWMNDEAVEDSVNFFLGGIQDYAAQLFDTQDDQLLKNMREISENILKYHPEHIPSLSNIGISYLINGDFERSLEPFLKAEKLNPADAIVVSNIARNYQLLGDKEQSIRYYEKVLELDNDQLKPFADEQLKEMKSPK